MGNDWGAYALEAETKFEQEKAEQGYDWSLHNHEGIREVECETINQIVYC